MHSLVFFREIILKKKNFELKTFEFFIDCKNNQQMQAFQILVFDAAASYHPFIKFLSTKLTFCHKYVNFWKRSNLSGQKKNSTRPALKTKGLECKKYKKPTSKLKNLGWKKVIKTLIDCCTIRDFFYIWGHLDESNQQPTQWSLKKIF